MKVLQIIDGEEFGGIAKLMLDIRNNIDDLEIDFLTWLPIFDDSVKNAYYLNISRKTLKGKIIYNHRLYKFLKKNKYDIIHVNSGVFLYSFQVALIARVVGIKKVIVHSHNTLKLNKFRLFLKTILNPLYRSLCVRYLSCSKDAEYSLFTKKFINKKKIIILSNGIDVDKFKFNEVVRNTYRKNLNLENKVVYGHTGMFLHQKNHEFLIDLFYEIQKKNKNAILLLIGSGEKEEKIKEKVKMLGISNKVLFLGFRTDINNLLCAMDIFLFPSINEGLGISVIEAQASGLPVFVSNAVPLDAKISNNYYKIDSYDVDEWLQQIETYKKCDRKNSYKNVIKYGFDIKETSNKLKKIYKDLMIER